MDSKLSLNLAHEFKETSRPAKLGAILVFLCVIAGCQSSLPDAGSTAATRPSTLPTTLPPVDAPTIFSPSPSQHRIWHCDPARSLIEITVRRSGPLAALGHDHLISIRQLGGEVYPDQNRAELQVQLQDLVVDDAALRQLAALGPQPGADAVLATRRNMLTKVFDVDRFPVVQLGLQRQGAGQLVLDITIQGQQRQMVIPALIEEDHAGLRVRGNLMLRQSEFGITPFSILGGALAVEDQLSLRFDIVATPPTAARL